MKGGQEAPSRRKGVVTESMISWCSRRVSYRLAIGAVAVP